MIDPTTLLAELAAIQRDVRTVAETHTLLNPTQRFCVAICERLASIMSSIAAHPPVDNGMLGPIRARLEELERQVASAAAHRELTSSRIDRHHDRICALEGKGR